MKCFPTYTEKVQSIHRGTLNYKTFKRHLVLKKNETEISKDTFIFVSFVQFVLEKKS